MKDNYIETRWNFANAISVPFSNGVDIYLADKQASSITVVTGIVATKHSRNEVEGQVLVTSPMRLDRDTAVRLLDALWNCGIRPSQDAQTVGQLAAVQKHLEDMRQIAFKKLSVEKP